MNATVGRIILRLGLAAKGYFPERHAAAFQSRQHLSDGDVRAYQDDLLRRLIQTAYDDVPYYQDLFRERGLRPSDIRTSADLAKLPVLTKDTVRREGARMLNRRLSRRKITVNRTGGSTGQPLSFQYPKALVSPSLATMWRNYARCGWQPGEMTGLLWGFHESDWRMPAWKMRLREFMSRTCRIDPYNLSREQVEAAIQRWRKACPTLLVAYPSALAAMGRYMLDHDIRLDGVRGVVTSAEVLHPAQRETIREAFGCIVLDMYGCGEVLHVACECAAGVMHVNADWAIVEFGEPVSEGRRPLILTGLRNVAMPFIRYANGDLAGREQPACACGIQFPTLKLDLSRSSDMFTLGNGRTVHGAYFTQTMFGADGVATFQYHQLTPGRIILRIVKGPRFGASDIDIIEKARRQVDEHSDGTSQVQVEYVDQIPVTERGKHRFTRSDVPIEW